MASAKTGKRRRRRWLWVLAPAIMIGLAVGAGLWYMEHLGIHPPVPFRPPFGGLQQVNVLILGVDSDSDPRRSDTIMIAALDLAQRRIGVLSVPRDFRVDIPGYSTQKINAAYSLGGVPLAAQTVQGLTGVQCQYYIKTTSAGLEKLVDALGGVEINVDKRMRYRDKHQGLFINLQPGLQRLNGNQAVGYVRFRHEATGDLARMRRQQIFVRAVMAEALTPRNLARMPTLLKAFAQAVETDLNLKDLKAIADLGQRLDPARIKGGTLPGAPVTIRGVDYMEPDQEAMPQMVAEVIYGARPRVEIVNATAIPGVQAGLVQQLGRAGYSVEVRFADHTSSTSEIMSSGDHAEEANEIRGLLHCGKVVRANGQAVHGAEITVVLGTDYIGQDNN